MEGAGPPESHQSSAVHPVQVPQGTRVGATGGCGALASVLWLWRWTGSHWKDTGGLYRQSGGTCGYHGLVYEWTWIYEFVGPCGDLCVDAFVSRHTWLHTRHMMPMVNIYVYMEHM